MFHPSFPLILKNPQIFWQRPRCTCRHLPIGYGSALNLPSMGIAPSYLGFSATRKRCYQFTPFPLILWNIPSFLKFSFNLLLGKQSLNLFSFDEIPGYHSSIDDVEVILECCAVSSDKYLPTFRREHIILIFRVNRPRKVTSFWTSLLLLPDLENANNLSFRNVCKYSPIDTV